MQGWISLHRRIKDHWVWADKPFSKGQAWIDILMMVNHEDKKILLGNELIEVKRGSRITSIRQLCDRWGWSNTKTKKFLELLQEDKMLVVKSDTKKTTLTVVNYSDYQNINDTKNDTETTEKRHESDTETTRKHTNNNDNNENNDNKNIYSPPPVPYEKIIELYNTICEALPKIQKITDKRKKTIKARWTQYNDIAIYEKLFIKAEDSDFLSGKNGKWTSCNFDWLINENNMVKVLEGNYDNKKSSKVQNDKKTRFHTAEQRTSKYTPEELEAIARKRRE